MSNCALLSGLAHEVDNFNFAYHYDEDKLLAYFKENNILRLKLNSMQVFKILSTYVVVVDNHKENILYRTFLHSLLRYFGQYKFIYTFELCHLMSETSFQPSDKMEVPFEALSCSTYRDDMTLTLSENFFRLALLFLDQ